jgi:hypothetical protein
MEVHQIIHHSTLEIVLDLVDNNLLAHVDQLDVGEVAFVLVNALIHLLIITDSVAKIGCGRFWVLTLIVGRRRLDFQYVGHDQLFVVALGLDK